MAKTDNTTSPPTLVAAAAPWYTSPVQKAQVTALVSALIALSPKIGGALGIKTAGDVASWVETVFGCITLAAPIVGTILRARSQLQPLTLTKKKAEEHPATIAAAALQGTTVAAAETAAAKTNG